MYIYKVGLSVCSGDSMPLGSVETELNLVWIFTGLGMRLFLGHIFGKWFT